MRSTRMNCDLRLNLLPRRIKYAFRYSTWHRTWASRIPQREMPGRLPPHKTIGQRVFRPSTRAAVSRASGQTAESAGDLNESGTFPRTHGKGGDSGSSVRARGTRAARRWCVRRIPGRGLSCDPRSQYRRHLVMRHFDRGINGAILPVIRRKGVSNGCANSGSRHRASNADSEHPVVYRACWNGTDHTRYWTGRISAFSTMFHGVPGFFTAAVSAIELGGRKSRGGQLYDIAPLKATLARWLISI